MHSATAPIIDIQSLTVAYRRGNAWADALREINLQIYPGQTYGLVGESGSGKTTLALAIMRHLSENAMIRVGRILFAGRELLNLSGSELRLLWGSDICLVPQNPLSALNPSMRIGEQVAEGFRLHKSMDRAIANRETLAILRKVRLPDAERVVSCYPHQISGGMQQRVMIAMAMSANPRLLILDEPTTNLDVTTQAAILDLLRDLIQESKAAVLYVTHNLGVLAQICDRVAVLYAGELVEDAPVEQIFRGALHPYTQALLASQPVLGGGQTGQKLRSIPGTIPQLGERSVGCVYAPRCHLVSDVCHQRPMMSRVSAEHETRCHNWQAIQSWPERGEKLDRSLDDRIVISGAPSLGERFSEQQTVLELRNLQVHFPANRSDTATGAGPDPRSLRAVNSISFSIKKCMTLGLVGESGSGKTTIARAVMGLIEPTEGELTLLGHPLPAKLNQRSMDTLRKLTMVFQNPEDALNPYMTIGETLRRPLIIALGISRDEADKRVEELLQAVQLPGNFVSRIPDQLSGGEKQRVAIARAFATDPDLLVADEPISSLDVSVQASILNLLKDLKVERGTAMLFISHDLAVVGYLADVIAVLFQGHVMEIGPAETIFQSPQHPYTEVLLAAVPQPDPQIRQKRTHNFPDLESLADQDLGCPFYSRCPRSLGELCARQPPPMQTVPGGKYFTCHITPDDLRRMQQSFPKTDGQ